MPKRKKGALSRIKNLGEHAKRKRKHDMGQFFNEDILLEPIDFDEVNDVMGARPLDNSGSVSQASSITSASAGSSEIELVDWSVEKEAEMLTFVAKMKQNMSSYLWSIKKNIQPSRYQKMGESAPRTKRHKRQMNQERTKALRMAGYPDIRSFFQQKASVRRNSVESFSSVSDSSIAPQILTGTDEEGTPGGIFLPEEEEEEEEEEGSPMGSTRATSPQPPMTPFPSSALEVNDSSDHSNKDEPDLGVGSRPHAHPPAPDSPLLENAIKILKAQIKKKKIEDTFRKRITAMLGFLNLYMTTPDISWMNASEIASITCGSGSHFARSLRCWVWELLDDEKSLPMSRHGVHRKSRIDDEDFAQEIQLHLQTLGTKYFSAMDVVRFLSDPEVQARLKIRKAPSEQTAQTWIKSMNYQYGVTAKGMYIDGHERVDVVDYRQKHFLPLWSIMEPRMTTWSVDNVPRPPVLPNFPHEKRIVLVTHDESTFYANDRQKKRWIHIDETAQPVQKGEGASLMVSDFVSPDLGWLKSKDKTREVRIIFKAGKNRDGYFGCDNLLKQIELAIELFEDNFPGNATAAFGFDNAPGHQKRADDALSARYMPKFPKHWWGKGGKCKMKNGVLPNGQLQDFYFLDNHPQFPGYFKGMARILEERGLVQEAKLNAECDRFKCTNPNAACCCRRVLFNQLDFINQKPAITELVESHGHLSFFYPKFHCELNFIEQCWGHSKFHYRMLPKTSNELEMERNVRNCLDKVDILKMRRYANRSARFIDAYRHGLSGTQAIWANKKYHGHRVLPEGIWRDLEEAGIQS